MAKYRNPETAPRDGTTIWGLFERRGKRAIGRRASFCPPDLEPPPLLAAEWIKDGHSRTLAAFQSDPVSFFRPWGDEPGGYDEPHNPENRLGRMIGWRPLS